MSDAAPRADQVIVCSRHCEARCCRYLTVSVPAPRSATDWDEMRWWLAHAGTLVSRDEEGWMLHVATPCSNLEADGTCAVHPDHMLACQEYDATRCEYVNRTPFPLELRSEEDLAAFLEGTGRRRGRRVAAAIRRAAARRAAAPGEREG